MQTVFNAMPKYFYALRVLSGALVIASQLLACSQQPTVDSYEAFQQPPDLHTAPNVDPQSNKIKALLKKGLGDQITLIEKTRESQLKMNVDSETALDLLESALVYNHIDVIDKDPPQGSIFIQVKHDTPTETPSSKDGDEHYGPDGVYSSGEGFLDNVNSLWKSKSETASEALSRYKLVAKQKDNSVVISAQPLTSKARFKTLDSASQKQLFATLYKSLREGFTTN